jgi:hypothetical protein
MVPAQVQPGARADLDQGERPPVRDRREGGRQRGAARRLIGLRAPRGERGLEPAGAVGAEPGERRGEPGARSRAADRRVVGGERVAGVAQQLVVDRGEEDVRRPLRRSRRQGEQLRRLRDQLADPRVERRVGPGDPAEDPERTRGRGGVHGLGR